LKEVKGMDRNIRGLEDEMDLKSRDYRTLQEQFQKLNRNHADLVHQMKSVYEQELGEYHQKMTD